MFKDQNEPSQKNILQSPLGLRGVVDGKLGEKKLRVSEVEPRLRMAQTVVKGESQKVRSMRPKTVYQERIPQNTIALVNSAQGQDKGHLYKKLFYDK